MNKTNLKWITAVLVSGLWLALTSCSENGLTAPGSVITGNSNGIATRDMHFVNWKPEVLRAIAAVKAQGIRAPGQLTKSTDDDGPGDGEYSAIAWRYIWKLEGGTVGGESTFNNKVEVPDHAYPELARLFVVAVTNADTVTNQGAAVDFLPSQQFQQTVRVTLGWDYLDFSGDPAELVLYWQNEETGLWVEVPGSTVDMDNGAVSGLINHFTSFAWGWGGDDGD